MSEVNQSKTKVDVVKNRRHFLKTASVTSLIAALPSRSVWGSSQVGCTASGHMSGNLSNPAQRNCVVSGFSPGYWHSDSHFPSDCIGVTWQGVFGSRSPFPNKDKGEYIAVDG